MKTLAFAALALPLLLTAAPAAAARCDNAQDQNTMNRCAAEDYARADAVLNRTYQKVMRDLDDHSRALLRASQREWIKFRDAECTYVNAANEGGSIYPLVYNGCLTDMTKTRTRQLQQGQN
ncbi:MAG: lysozyme inhibitor LprI family protein [Rhizomicrobium sp.]